MTGRREAGLRVGVEPGKLRRVAPRELGLRFAFGAGISIAAALVGMRFGHRVGGLFLAFPAILPASLTLISDKDGRHRARVNAIGAVLGGVALAGFAAVALWLLPRTPLALTLLAATGAWLVAASALYFASAYGLGRLDRDPAAPDRAHSLRRREPG